MQMSDYEILQSWNNAVDRNAQVQILADLNAVSKKNMREKLESLGVEGLPAAPQRKKKTAPADGRKNQNLKMDELRAMELYNEGLCDLELADALGVTKPTVCQWRKRMRLAPHPQKRRCTGLDEYRAMELYNEGLCDLDIAETLGVSRNTVADWRKRKDLKCHRQRPGYVQEMPKKSQDRTGQDRTGQDRTGGEGCAWLGGEACGKASTYGCGRHATRDAASARGFSTGGINSRRALCA